MHACDTHAAPAVWIHSDTNQPDERRYQRWFYFSVVVSLLAGWLEPYHMAFGGQTRLK